MCSKGTSLLPTLCQCFIHLNKIKILWWGWKRGQASNFKQVSRCQKVKNRPTPGAPALGLLRGYHPLPVLLSVFLLCCLVLYLCLPGEWFRQDKGVLQLLPLTLRMLGTPTRLFTPPQVPGTQDHASSVSLSRLLWAPARSPVGTTALH